MSKRKNRSIPQIPAPAPKPEQVVSGKVELETHPVSGLAQQAFLLLKERHDKACEAVAREASAVEGYLEKDGWKLDLTAMVWFRAKPKP